MADVKVDIATVFSGKKAFNDAIKSTIGLNNQVKTLAKSYLGLFTVQRLGRAGFDAVKAFAADDKAARVLSKSVNNLGLAFADPAIRNFIHSMEQTYGVMDDFLRPAFQKLLTTTGDVYKSQQLLQTALDLSAASGIDVVSVAGDLSKAYVGQTRALSKYGLGLSQATLKAMSFEQVQGKINELFSGQAALTADTYSGKIDKLTVAAKNAQETIGKGLVDALSKFGGTGTDNLDKVISKMDTLSRLVSAIPNVFADVFQAVSNPASFYKQNATKPTYMGAIPSINAELKKAAAEKAAAKARAALTKTTKAQTAAIKEQTALQKAGTLFDLEQTQIVAALKGKISEDERKRLELQLALLTGNTSEASKLAGELGKSQGLSEKLVAFLKDLPKADNPFSGWKDYLDAIEAQVLKIASAGSVGGATTPVNMSNAAGMNVNDMTDYIYSGGSKSGQLVPQVNVQVTLDGQELTGAITNIQTNNSLSGDRISLNRRNGSFATP
jgi:hypothetical protein